MSRTRRRILLGFLILAAILNYADRQIIAVLKPAIAASLHWNDQDYGVATSIFQLAAAGAYLFAGWFVDKVGLKWANPVGVASWSLATLAHTAVRGFAGFVAVRACLGACETANTPAAVKTTAILYSDAERPMVLGVLNGANNVGAILTPLLAPALALAFGWRAAFVVVGVAGLAWAAAWFPLVFGHIGDPVEARKAAPEARVGYREALRDRRTWAIMGAKALSDQVWWFLLFWTPDLFTRVFHLRLDQLGAPLAAVYGCAALGSFAGGYASGRLTARGVRLDVARKGVLLVCAVMALPLAFAASVSSLWAAVALLGLTLAAHQAFSTNLFTLVADIIPSARVGSVTSLGALCGNLAGMSVLAGVGWAFARGSGYRPFLVAEAFAYLLALGWLQLVAPTLTPAASEGCPTSASFKPLLSPSSG